MVHLEYASCRTTMHSKTLFQDSNILKKGLGKLNSWKNEDWNIFIEEKKPN